VAGGLVQYAGVSMMTGQVIGLGLQIGSGEQPNAKNTATTQTNQRVMRAQPSDRPNDADKDSIFERACDPRSANLSTEPEPDFPTLLFQFPDARPRRDSAAYRG
jgi:hypothetical protein